MRLDCLRAVDLLDRKRQGIPQEEAAWLEAHLQGCARCQAIAADQADIQRLMDLWPPMSADLERALPAIRARIAQENAGRPTSPWMRLAGAGIAIGVAVGIAMAAFWAGARPKAFPPAAPIEKTSPPIARKVALSTPAEVLRPTTHRRKGESRCYRRHGTPTLRPVVLDAPMRSRQTPSPPPIAHPSAPEFRFTARVASADEAKELARFFLLPPPEPHNERAVLTVTPADGPVNAPELQEAETASSERMAILLQALGETVWAEASEPPPPSPAPYEAAPASPAQSGSVGSGGWS